MDDLTVVYYSASQERASFEQCIVRQLLEDIGDCPLISVTQKPLECGQNICVGEIGVRPENAIRQALLGVQEAATQYVALAESDCLHGPEYFRFRPASEDVWCCPGSGYVTWVKRMRFWPKRMQELVGITSRDHAIRVLTAVRDASPGHVSDEIRRQTKYFHFNTRQQPVITIKTRQQMHWATPHGSEGVGELPGWGTAESIWRRVGL